MSAPQVTAEQVRATLDAPMPDPNDADAATVRDYLVALLLRVWDEAEGFSGKRPFGNSGWQQDVYEALAHAGLVTATFDEDGYLDEIPDDQQILAETLVLCAIRELGAARPAEGAQA